MTEKRFIMDEDGNITDTFEGRTLYVENLKTECNYFTNLLNELHEENLLLMTECSSQISRKRKLKNELKRLGYSQNKIKDIMNR